MNNNYNDFSHNDVASEWQQGLDDFKKRIILFTALTLPIGLFVVIGGQFFSVIAELQPILFVVLFVVFFIGVIFMLSQGPFCPSCKTNIAMATETRMSAISYEKRQVNVFTLKACPFCNEKLVG